jgi:hypothetical protein
MRDRAVSLSQSANQTEGNGKGRGNRRDAEYLLMQQSWRTMVQHRAWPQNVTELKRIVFACRDVNCA